MSPNLPIHFTWMEVAHSSETLFSQEQHDVASQMTFFIVAAMKTLNPI
jgi:hypothetical protein